MDHIAYWEFLSEKTSARYTQYLLQSEPVEETELEAVPGLEETYYGHTQGDSPDETWEVMLARQGKQVVKVTYAGEKALRPCVERWRTAILPAE